MSEIERPEQSDHPSLRRPRLHAFGASREDIAMLDTHKLKTVQKAEVPDALPTLPLAALPADLMPTRPLAALSADLMPTRPLAVPPPPRVQKPGGVHSSGASTRSRPITPIIPFPVDAASSITPQKVGDSFPQPPPQNPLPIKSVKRKKYISVALRVGITLLLFFFLFKSFSWSTLLQALTRVDYGKLALGLIVGWFGIIVSSYQWRSLLRSERIRYDLAELIDLYMVGIAFSHFLPTGMGGDVVKAMQVGRKSRNSAGSASAVLMSRITGFLGMLLVAFPVLLIWHDRFSASIVLWFGLLSLLVGGMLGGAVLIAVLLPKFSRGKWANHRLMASVLKIGNALKATTRRPLALGIAILYGAQFWVVGCLNYYAYGLALGIQVPPSFYFVAVPFVSLITFLPISINGFGVREGAFVYIFATAHVSSATALLLALFMDAQVLLFGVIGGLIYLTTGGKDGAAKKAQRQDVA